ncbi:unnamed protein product [Acanthosepion pharaonis]|uniref:Uncharacterized protein n=1 Tax=Acanthosepion pharaonis TaxID=158019 RepID=A0A812CKF2_ACAPH|nr:unnamed protein product [Sepia pharaonis]
MISIHAYGLFSLTDKVPTSLMSIFASERLYDFSRNLSFSSSRFLVQLLATSIFLFATLSPPPLLLGISFLVFYIDDIFIYSSLLYFFRNRIHSIHLYAASFSSSDFLLSFLFFPSSLLSLSEYHFPFFYFALFPSAKFTFLFLYTLLSLPILLSVFFSYLSLFPFYISLNVFLFSLFYLLSAHSIF